MRLHKLTLTAFGPFAGTEHIDFDALSDTGILLIHGPTGAGKTSLLDAIAFGLFGDVPGARRSLRSSLRSHHAAEGVRPVVELEFSVGQRRWRVERSPQWEARKKRGNGMTPRHATVLVQEFIDDDWVVRSSRIPEAAELMQDVLGMGLEQFAQVALLPQGEFAQFLRAKPEDRRTLLERLFDVGRFERIEEWFSEQKARHARVLELTSTTISTQLDTIAHTLAEINDDRLVTPQWSPTQIPELREELRGVVAVLRTRRDNAQDQARATHALSETARNAAREALITQQLHHECDSASGTLARIPREHLVAMKARIDAAHAAELVLNVEKSRNRAEQAASAARLQLDTLTSAAETLPEELSTDEWRIRSRDRMNVANAAVALLKLATNLDRSATAAGSRRADAAKAAAELAEAKQRLTRGVQAHAAALEAAEMTPSADAALQSVRRVLESMDEGAPLRKAQDRARSRAEDALQTAHLSEQHVRQLRQQRLDSIAGELAAGLSDGMACVVCGSLQHPNPAEPVDITVVTSQLEAAEKAADEAAAKAVTAQSARAESDARVAAWRERLKAEWSAAANEFAAFPAAKSAWAQAAEPNVEAAQTALAALTTAQAAAHEAQQAVEKTAKAVETAEAAHAQREARSAAAQATRDSAQEQVAAAQAELADALGDFDGAQDAPEHSPEQLDGLRTWLQERHDSARAASGAAEEAARLLERLETARLVHDQARAAADRAAQEVDAVVSNSPFADVVQAKDAALTSVELAAIEQDLTAATRRRDQAEHVLEDPAHIVAAMTPAANVEVLRHRAQQLARRAEAARDAASASQAALKHVDSLRNSIADELNRYADSAQRAHEITNLAQTFGGNGENTHKMRLTSYVLAAYLETITELANHRLARMSDGRYQLQHTDERAARGAHSGLGLKVMDAWTGQLRDTATLSGGEAFMASLALALGLGDAVLADSGGLELHTLFVDEGFGSLDSDTLEEVMQVLDDLREGGRLVGIVSHVTELKARIPTHIEVVKTSEGSTLRPVDFGSAVVTHG